MLVKALLGIIGARRNECPMLSFALDFVFVAIGAAAFAATALYLNACANL